MESLTCSDKCNGKGVSYFLLKFWNKTVLNFDICFFKGKLCIKITIFDEVVKVLYSLEMFRLPHSQNKSG